MGTNPKPWFCSSMNKINGQTRMAAVMGRSRPDTGSPVATRLRVTMKAGKSSWTVPLQYIAQKAASTELSARRVELSLIRSVAQSSLRRNGSVWGR